MIFFYKALCVLSNKFLQHHKQAANLVLLLILCLTSNYLFAERPVIECPILQSPPKIDGFIDDASWKNASEVYLHNNNKPYKRSSAHDARVKLLSDGSRLYVLAILNDPNTSTFNKTEQPRDKMKWKETFEVFLAPEPDQATYYHIAMDPAGTLFDNIGLSSATDHNYSVVGATRITKNGWQVELSIPLKEIGFPAGVTNGTVMEANFCRMTRSGPRTQAWSATSGPFHVRNCFGTLIFGDSKQAATKLLDSLLNAVDDIPNVNSQVVGELNSLKKFVKKVKNPSDYLQFEIAVKQYRQKLAVSELGKGTLIFWECNPWQLPQNDIFPKPSEVRKKISVDAIRNEYVTLAVAIGNTSDEPIRLRCVPNITKQKESGKTIKTDSFLTIRRAVDIAVRSGGTQRDALPPLLLESVFDIRPSSNEILWLTIYTGELLPGSYEFSIAAIPTVKRDYRSKILINLTVYDAVLPLKYRPNTHVWARWTWPPVRDIRMECYQDLEDHYTTFVMGERDGSDVGYKSLKYDDNGNIISGPIMTGLQKKIDFFGRDKTYLYPIRQWYFPAEFYGGKKIKEDIRKHRVDVLNYPHLKRNMRHYLDGYYETLEKNGINNNEALLFYLTDEPDLTDAKHAADMAKLMFSIYPEKVHTFVTIYSATTMETIRTLLPYVTHWCPTVNIREEVLDLIRKEGRPDMKFVMGYQVKIRLHDVYRSYRLHFLQAMSRGMGGAAFWNYCDAGDSDTSTTWDDFESKRKLSDYAAIYEGSKKPVPSVRWEAWRQGVQDWIYVQWLKELAQETLNTSLKRQALQLADDAVSKTLSSPDKTMADHYYREMRKMILCLLQNKNTHNTGH